MVTLAVVSVFGKLLARHVMIECWWMRDKFFMSNLLVCVESKEKSNLVPSTNLPFHNHWIFGGGEPPRTSHNNTISLPSSYGPANDWIISPRSFIIFGFCGGTEKVYVQKEKEEKKRINFLFVHKKKGLIARIPWNIWFFCIVFYCFFFLVFIAKWTLGYKLLTYNF